MRTLTTWILACGLALAAGDTLALEKHLNLDFEDGVPGASPKGWFAGGEGYDAGLVADDPHGGRHCLKLARTDAAKAGFGVATGSFPIEVAAGHRIRFTGWIRTAGVTGKYAGLWWRVDGPDGMLAFDNMSDRGVTGDTGWTQYAIELDVAPEVVNINFGCLLPGDGTAWFDDLEVFIDGEPFVQERPEPFAADADQVAWIRAHAHPFATDDPAAATDDLAFVGELVGDARLVALGEGTHGTSEFFRMKDRLLRYLVTELGFTVFVIEATMPECEAINAYVRGGEGDPAALVAGMYFWTWKTEEVLAMVEWMRAHNAAGGHVEFHGNDMQSPGLAMKKAQDFLAAHAPDLHADAVAAYAEVRGLARAAQGTGRRMDRMPDRLETAVAGICDELESRYSDLAARAPAADVAWGLQYARLVEQFVRMNRDRMSGVRDEAMAANTDWLLAQAGPDARMVVWAHNGHVSRDGYGNFASMGNHLAARHGDDLVVIGFCFGEGTYTAMKRGEGLGAWGTSAPRPGSLEWAFGLAGEPRLVLDLRDAQPGSPASDWVHRPLEMRSIGAMAMDDGFGTIVPAEHYDAVIWFAASTPSVQLDVERPSSWAMWD